jgi:SAM-dependent methyltransferase
MDRKEHWEDVYSSKPSDRLGWYKPRLQTSLDRIRGLQLAPDAPIIDVGAGASTLIDDLLALGHTDITVLDISDKALSLLRNRLGDAASKINWIVSDVTAVELPDRRFELWHDRAAFHFLTEPHQQQQYRRNLREALMPGGHLLIGTFAPEAPPKCSGLPVQRYDRELLTETFGAEFELIDHHKEMHVTPGGVEQMYLYCHFQRRNSVRPE